MKRYFITGIVTLLPVALTLIIITFFFNLLTTPFLGAVKSLFEVYGLFENGFLLLNANQLQNLIAKLLILLLLVSFTIGLGYLVRWFFFHSILKVIDRIVHRIPLVRSIYKASQEVIKTIFTSKTNSFKQVVMVRFPNADTYAIGLVTREDIPPLQGTAYENIVAVFIPTTPNPTSGFMILFKRQDLVYLDMKVQDAIKYVVSCGVILPEFQVMPNKTNEPIEPPL